MNRYCYAAALTASLTAHSLVADTVELTTGDLLHTLMQNEAAKEGHRLTILLPSFGPGMDLAQLCIDAGLRVNSLLSHRVRAGAFLASVRVTGPWEAVEALLVRLRRDGAILVEGADLRETA